MGACRSWYLYIFGHVGGHEFSVGVMVIASRDSCGGGRVDDHSELIILFVRVVTCAGLFSVLG